MFVMDCYLIILIYILIIFIPHLLPSLYMTVVSSTGPHLSAAL